MDSGQSAIDTYAEARASVRNRFGTLTFLMFISLLVGVGVAYLSLGVTQENLPPPALAVQEWAPLMREEFLGFIEPVTVFSWIMGVLAVNVSMCVVLAVRSEPEGRIEQIYRHYWYRRIDSWLLLLLGLSVNILVLGFVSYKPGLSGGAGALSVSLAAFAGVFALNGMTVVSPWKVAEELRVFEIERKRNQISEWNRYITDKGVPDYNGQTFGRGLRMAVPRKAEILPLMIGFAVLIIPFVVLMERSVYLYRSDRGLPMTVEIQLRALALVVTCAVLVIAYGCVRTVHRWSYYSARNPRLHLYFLPCAVGLFYSFMVSFVALSLTTIPGFSARDWQLVATILLLLLAMPAEFMLITWLSRRSDRGPFRWMVAPLWSRVRDSLRVKERDLARTHD